MNQDARSVAQQQRATDQDQPGQGAGQGVVHFAGPQAEDGKDQTEDSQGDTEQGKHGGFVSTV